MVEKNLKQNEKLYFLCPCCRELMTMQTSYDVCMKTNDVKNHSDISCHIKFHMNCSNPECIGVEPIVVPKKLIPHVNLILNMDEFADFITLDEGNVKRKSIIMDNPRYEEFGGDECISTSGVIIEFNTNDYILRDLLDDDYDDFDWYKKSPAEIYFDYGDQDDTINVTVLCEYRKDEITMQQCRDAVYDLLVHFEAMHAHVRKSIEQ